MGVFFGHFLIVNGKVLFDTFRCGETRDEDVV